MANLDKNAIINLKNDAHLENTYNTNIVFSTADQDSDTLRFKLLKNDGLPYIIGNVNVGGKIKLDHEDGSFWIDDLKVVENELKYQFEYKLPNELLQRNGKVTAQVLVYEKGNSNLIVAQRKFTFTVQNSIYQNISAEDKTTYIVEFADLKQEIRQSVVDINEALENGEDFVTQVKTSHREALDAIQTLVTSSTDELNNLGDKRLNEIQTTASDYLSQIDTKNADAQKMIDDFKNYLIDQDIVLVSDTEDWQKYKLTNDDGRRTYLNKGSFDVHDLSTGLYESVGDDDATTQNLPSATNNAFIEIDVTESDGGDRKQIYVLISYNKRLFLKTLHTNGSDTDWKEVALFDENNPFETTSGSQEKATTAQTNAKEYTDSQHQMLFDGNASGTGNEFTLDDDIYNYNILFVSGEFPGGVFTEPILVKTINNDLVIQRFNLSDDSGSLSKFYETILTATDNKNLKIKHDIAYNFETGNPISQSNVFTIYRIEGWK